MWKKRKKTYVTIVQIVPEPSSVESDKCLYKPRLQS